MSKGGKKSINQEDTVGGRGGLQTRDTKTEETLPPPLLPQEASKHLQHEKHDHQHQNHSNFHNGFRHSKIANAKVTRVGESYVNRYGSSLKSLPQETP